MDAVALKEKPDLALSPVPVNWKIDIKTQFYVGTYKFDHNHHQISFSNADY